MNNKPIQVDLSKIQNMKCFCGADVFSQVFNLKYISPILCGDPKGATANVFMWRCSMCGQLYPAAIPAGEVKKLYNQLSLDQKATVDALKFSLEAKKVNIQGG